MSKSVNKIATESCLWHDNNVKEFDKQIEADFKAEYKKETSAFYTLNKVYNFNIPKINHATYAVYLTRGDDNILHRVSRTFLDAHFKIIS